MLRSKNLCIDCKGFASLILDYEFPSDETLDSYVSCRVLIEDLYQTRIIGKTRDECIEQFRSGAWKVA